MIVRLSTDAIIDAERFGRGPLSWGWVFPCGESTAVLARSEPMFRTRSAALRVGNHVMHTRRARQGLTALDLLVADAFGFCRPSTVSASLNRASEISAHPASRANCSKRRYCSSGVNSPLQAPRPGPSLGLDASVILIRRPPKANSIR